MLKKFLTEERGAVTADWVVLTAGIVTLGLFVGLTVSAPTNDLATDIGGTLQAMDPKAY